MNIKIKDEKHALIDRVKFKNVMIESVEKRDNQEDIIIKNTTLNNNVYYTINLNLLETSGYLFKTARNYLGNSTDTYSTLEVNVDRESDLRNLNCLTADDYKNRVSRVTEEIKEDYGIKVGMANAEIQEIEINKTFEVKNEMKEYERVFNLFIANLPPKAKFRFNNDGNNLQFNGSIERNTFYAQTKRKKGYSSNYKTLKFYNKSEDLKVKSEFRIVTDQNFMRVEITLVGSKTIRRELGTNKLNELTDEGVNRYFDEKMREWIVEPTEKWQTNQQRKVLQIMKDCKAECGYKWINKALSRVINEEISIGTHNRPLILDVEEIVPLINKMYKSADKRKRAKQALRKAVHSDMPNLARRDDLKLAELISHLQAESSANLTAKNRPCKKVV